MILLSQEKDPERGFGGGGDRLLPVLDREGTPIEDLHVPMVQLVCTNRSYVMLYAAVPIGLP
ncbi:MAG: hypothetical protein M3Q49_19230 [Actinomycetota bacterium]|nr:hypothetical protein [Actinomycetota bacterium]